MSFDILALLALFMVPRVCSVLSLSPYWGTLIPCLKEMGKDFVKFMVLVFIVYLGFLTTFTLVARDTFVSIPLVQARLHDAPEIADQPFVSETSSHDHELGQDLLWLKLYWV